MEIEGTVDKKRLEAFVDAILAILLTILVLEFKVPRIEHADTTTLKHEIWKLFPAFICYTASFFTVIGLWIDHQFLFRSVKYATKNFALLNFLFLLTVSPLPFTTAFAGEYIHNSFAVAVFVVNIFLMNVAFASIFGFVLSKKLVPDDFMDTNSKAAGIISIIGLIVEALCIPLAYYNTILAIILTYMVLFAHLLKRRGIKKNN